MTVTTRDAKGSHSSRKSQYLDRFFDSTKRPTKRQKEETETTPTATINAPSTSDANTTE